MLSALRALLLCSLVLSASCSSDAPSADVDDAGSDDPKSDAAARPTDASSVRADAGDGGARLDGSRVDASRRGDAASDARDVEPADAEPSNAHDARASDGDRPDAGSSGDAGSSEGARSTGPGDWVAGDYPKGADAFLDITDIAGQPGKTRQYKVHVPASYDPQKPTPVVFCIHGLGQNALMFCANGADMVAKSDAEGFILVMPNGYMNSWNGGTCCGVAASEKLDDVAFMRAIFKEVSGHLNIDLSRVYATGLSNGGYLSYRLACEAADIFVAVAPGAGAIGMNDIGGGTATTGDFAACKPSAPVSVLHLHGTADPLVRYALQKPSLDRIASENGCMMSTRAAQQPTSAGDTTCVTYDACRDGVEVTGCTVMGGGHVWFGNATCGTGAAGACAIVGANSTTLNNTNVIWEFFKAHPRE